VNRRHFIRCSAFALGSGLAGWPALRAAQGRDTAWDPNRPLIDLGAKLKVQPLFMYQLPVAREAASWKSWGGIQTEAAVGDEITRIQRELSTLAAQADLGVEFLPVAKIASREQLKSLSSQSWDATLLYANTGGGDLLQACLALKPDNLLFVRHRSGPIYYWYEALSTRFLSTNSAGVTNDRAGDASRAHVDDVVVDDVAELAWRIRALRGIKNFLGSKIVALGGPWGKYAPDAPQKAEERFGLKIVDVSYDSFAPRVQQALAQTEIMSAAERAVDQYLGLPQTVLRTERKFVVNAFVLHRLFKELLQENNSSVFTIKSCMGTILPMARTTACLTLGLLNDEGLVAFCESDFVIIPAGLLFRHIAGKPVFLHNSTFPHKATVTCAHCTSPRRLNGQRYEPVELLTHYESDYGAAPKVDMPLGQEISFISPQYSSPRWVGFKGVVRDNPHYEICRSQQDVEIQGDWKRLTNEVRDSHWVMAYGDYLKELGYAARKLGLQWDCLG
jgi:hypothetical protein